jgi:selenide,water dikinase
MFPDQAAPNMLVGLGAPDDAAVWRIDDDQALVVTLDFFTPVVDDAYDYGAVAAANALSDLYAMGARPVFALNIAAMPASLPPAVIASIMLGGAEKVREAGAVVAGGHSIQDDEPKYGLVAVGLAKQAELITKAGASPGDVLLLSKPLGTGVTTTALKNGAASEADVAQVVRWMSALNEASSALARRIGVRAGTDVTGFGLLGHAAELAQASACGLELFLGSIPFFEGALGYARTGHISGGSADNRHFFKGQVEFEAGIEEALQMLLFDAQTSGGLLLSVPEARVGAFLAEADGAGIAIWPIGMVLEGGGIKVRAGTLPAHEARTSPAPGLWFFDSNA